MTPGLPGSCEGGRSRQSSCAVYSGARGGCRAASYALGSKRDTPHVALHSGGPQPRDAGSNEQTHTGGPGAVRRVGTTPHHGCSRTLGARPGGPQPPLPHDGRGWAGQHFTEGVYPGRAFAQRCNKYKGARKAAGGGPLDPGRPGSSQTGQAVSEPGAPGSHVRVGLGDCPAAGRERAPPAGPSRGTAARAVPLRA